MISIIIPIYNAEKYLSECLDSVLSQTYKDFEIILINDGSKDNSESICKDFQKRNSRIKYIFQENSGASKARKKGVQNVNGEWIMFVDADDTIEQNTLQILIENSQNADIIVAEIDVRWKNTIYGEMTADIYTSLLLKRKLNPGPVAKLFRRNLFSEYIFDIPKKIVVGEDFIMNVRIAQNASRIKIIKDCIYHYRQLNESISHKNRWNLFNFLDVHKCLKASISSEKAEKFKWVLRASFFCNLKWMIANRIRIRTRIREALKSCRYSL
jgi:glycosyltransferase involved in cell wall biosynthesis